MAAKINPLAGKPADPSMLANIPRLVTAYFAGKPDPSVPAQRVAFGTSGHRGSALNHAFNESHILAISQALCDHRQRAGIDGPLFVGIDTHALAEPALASALEVFAANGVEVMIDEHDGYTPTPVISHAILTYNKGRENGLADGVVITPSHNPPEDGGFKYNPPNGGPADTDITGGDRARRQRLSRRRAQGRQAHSLRPRAQVGLRASLRLHRALCRRPRQCRRHGGDPRLRREDRHRSAGRRRRALLAADHRALRPRRDHRQRRGRSDLPLHDGGLGRQDPDGLLVALCDGAADRDARQVRRRLCQRHRRRPPRHRDPLQRADESEPLSRRRDRLSVRATARNGARTARSARPSSPARSSTASPKNSAASWSRRRSASNGSSTA